MLVKSDPGGDGDPFMVIRCTLDGFSESMDAASWKTSLT